MVIKKILPHEIEVSEGVPISIKKRKLNIPLPCRMKDGQMSFKVSFVTGAMSGPLD